MAAIASAVKVIRTAMVAPAIPTQRQRIYLSNLDILWLPVDRVQRLLFYKISPQIEFSSLAEKLRKSLSSVLVSFYPVAGRIEKDDSGRAEIDCNDNGVEFIEASIDIAFSEAEKDDFQHKPFFEHLAPKQDSSAPLLSVQVTAFEGGEGICVGTTFHHGIADGMSFWQFMKSWSECSRGLPVSDPPLHDRTFFKWESKSPLPISPRLQEIANDRISGARISKLLAAVPQPEVSRGDTEKPEGKRRKWPDTETESIYSTFHFTEEMIRKLKERSGAKSSFVAVTSHFWRSVMKAIGVPLEETVGFGVLTDCRGRVKPPLPKSYFGNCIYLGLAQTTAEKLQSQDGHFVAELIQELINSCTAEVQIKNMVEWLESLESADKGLFALIGDFMKHPGTNVVSSHRFPVYEVDYGWGRPLNVQAASIIELGGMVLFGEREGGGIAVTTRLPSKEMESLRGLLLGEN